MVELKPKYELKKEIATLSSKLKELGIQKENKYNEKKDVNNKLNSLLQDVNQLKEQRNDINKKIQEKKVQRDSFNNEVKQLAEKLKSAKQNQEEVPKEGYTPSRKIQFEIDGIQKRIETEVMSFEKEQSLMKVVRELQVKLKHSKSIEDKFGSEGDLRRQIAMKKRQADLIHKEIQELAGQNSEVFKLLTDKSKQIAAIKDNKSDCQNLLKKLKDEIQGANNKLGDILKLWSDHRKDESIQLAKEGIAQLRAKVVAVRDKLASRKKLTTEDILALQREGMER